MSVLSSSITCILIFFGYFLDCPTIVINLSWLNDNENKKVPFALSTLANQNKHHTVTIIYHIIPSENKTDTIATKSSTGFSRIGMKDKVKKYRKSERVCMEFKNLFSSRQHAFHLMGMENISRMMSTSPQNLKWQLPTNVHTVVGGENAIVGEFPHIAALGSVDLTGKFILHCGGTLIDHRWILTAAHCTQSSLGHLTAIRLGITHLWVQNYEEKIIGIKKIIRHPSYNPPQIYFDIALLELDRFINFSSSIRPACLHQDFNDVSENTWVCGWGTTEFGGKSSSVLQKAKLKILDNIWCSTKFNQSMTIPHGIVPSMICAGSPDDGWKKDTCQGDSGGPLQMGLPYHYLFSIIGITSFGASCAFNESPGIYTRVSHYISWIEDIVWPNNDYLIYL